MSGEEAGGACDGASIARTLAPVLGDEGAESAVREAVSELGYHEKELSRREQGKVLEWLAERPGLIGSAARRARAKREQRPSVAAHSTDEPSGRAKVTSPVASLAIGRSELVAMFARALGEEKAREMIDAECKRSNLSATAVPIASALELLEGLARGSGLIAVTARFAKARLALRK